MSLGKLGRKVYVSQRGLEQILADLREQGSSLKGTSRESIKRARDKETASFTTTAFGQVLVNMTFFKPNGEEMKLPILHPAAMLACAAQSCEAFARFFGECVDRDFPTAMKPWRMMLYSDEISPGNQLKHCNRRKTQTIYYSFMEFQAAALGSEYLWFTLTCVRSTLVNELGGMTAVFCKSPDFSKGLPINIRGRPGGLLFFSRIASMISDEAAIKAALANKGASGLVFCCLCQNCVDHKNAVAEAGEGMVSSLETDIAKFRLHTPDILYVTRSIFCEGHRRCIRSPVLRGCRQPLVLTFNRRPDGILSHTAFGAEVITTVTFDWFHIYCVHGVADALRSGGWRHQQVDDFVSSFHWPHRLSGAAPKNLLQKRSVGDRLTGSASDRCGPACLSGSLCDASVPREHARQMQRLAAAGKGSGHARSRELWQNHASDSAGPAKGSFGRHPAGVWIRVVDSQMPHGAPPSTPSQSAWRVTKLFCT